MSPPFLLSLLLLSLITLCSSLKVKLGKGGEVVDLITSVRKINFNTNSLGSLYSKYAGDNKKLQKTNTAPNQVINDKDTVALRLIYDNIDKLNNIKLPRDPKDGTIPVLAEDVLIFNAQDAATLANVNKMELILAANNRVIRQQTKVVAKSFTYALMKGYNFDIGDSYVLLYPFGATKQFTALSGKSGQAQGVKLVLYNVADKLGASFDYSAVPYGSDINPDVFYPIGSVITCFDNNGQAPKDGEVVPCIIDAAYNEGGNTNKFLGPPKDHIATLLKKKRDVADVEKMENVAGQVPLQWVCDKAWYGSNDSCDCDCGAPDPDCNPQNPVSALCYYPGKCKADGSCPLPVQWDCLRDWYDTGDGCDAYCTGYDPDCDDPNLPIYGCSGKVTRNPTNGFSICTPVSLPQGWTCSANNYGTADGCHCDCGAPDPDCEKPRDYGVCGKNAYCETGTCRTTDVPAAWFCDSLNYAANDGCDCECGAVDPDCQNPANSANVPVLNCPCDNMKCESSFCVGMCNGLLISLASADTPKSSANMLNGLGAVVSCVMGLLMIWLS